MDPALYKIVKYHLHKKTKSYQFLVVYIINKIIMSVVTPPFSFLTR